MYVLLEFWQKNHGDPYYEPTIVVHDYELLMECVQFLGTTDFHSIHGDTDKIGILNSTYTNQAAKLALVHLHVAVNCESPSLLFLVYTVFFTFQSPISILFD